MTAAISSAKSRSLIIFATRWGAQFGGINSFNQDLTAAFAAACHQIASTICVVLQADAQEQTHAQSCGVQLVSLGVNDSSFSVHLEPKTWQLLQRQGALPEPEQIVWLGHDRISGSIALEAARQRGGRAALIHHMSYARYESFTENSALAAHKHEEQETLFNQAHILLAVGPLLKSALEDMLVEEKPVAELIPGLPEIQVRRSPATFKAFISGRLSEDACRLKQSYLGIHAFADAIRQADTTAGLPTALKGSSEPTLTLRGVDFESCNAADASNAERDLKTFAEGIAERAFTLHALPFTTDRQRLFKDLSTSSVAMMPSWHEGFGLVAWEAIAAGVPLILSNKSGVYHLLDRLDHGIYKALVSEVDIKGKNDSPYYQQEDVRTLASAIIDIARDEVAARQKAACLREKLSSEFTWTACARQLAEALGWPLPDSDPPLTGQIQPALPSEGISQPATTSLLLELPEPGWRSAAGLSDSQLLRAEEAIVPFDPARNGFLQQQHDWALDARYLLTVRLLTGEGGTGKTRLALELCRKLRDSGWQAGFLPGDAGQSHATRLAGQLGQSTQPCCVVIDYAETRQPVLLALIKQLLRQPSTSPIRLLLLARSGGEWWDALPSRDSTCESLLEGQATSGPYPLPHLHASASQRFGAYESALQAFSAVLGIPVTEQVPDLADEHFAHPLYLQMAALVALRGERLQSAEALQRAVLNHERRYWGKVLCNDGKALDEDVRLATLLMTLATLAGSIPTERSIEKAWSSLDEDKAQLKRIFRALEQLYPGQQGLLGLRPDLIGEALVTRSLLTGAGSQLLKLVMTGERALRLSGLTVLARILRNRGDLETLVESALSEHLPACIDEVMDVCIETPSCLSEIAERAFLQLPPPKRLQLATRIERRTEHDIVQLNGLGVLAGRSIIAAQKSRLSKKARPIDKLEFSHSCNSLAISLVWIGNTQDALEYSSLAINTLEKLHKSDSTTSCLAKAISTHANCLAELGRHQAALQETAEALKLYQELTTKEPERYEPELALTLANHANRLMEQGDHEQGLTISADAVNLSRKLAKSAPERFKPRLANSLNNHANHLAEHGSHLEAMEVSIESLELHKELARSRPERFTSTLALALLNHSYHLSERGDYQRAVKTSRESLEIYQYLAKSRPMRYQSALADILKNLSIYESALGRHHVAQQLAKQALAIYTELSTSSLKVFLADQESCQWWLAFLHWLEHGKTPTEGLTNEPPVLDNPRQQRSLNFQRLVISAFFSAEPAAIKQALRASEFLDNGQQHDWDSSIFMLTMLAIQRLGTDSVPEALQMKANQLRSRRNNHLPQWMHVVADRAGLKL